MMTRKEVRNLTLKDVFTVAEAAEKTNVPKRTIYGWIERDLIKPFAFSSRLFFDNEAIKSLKRMRRLRVS